MDLGREINITVRYNVLYKEVHEEKDLRSTCFVSDDVWDVKLEQGIFVKGSYYSEEIEIPMEVLEWYPRYCKRVKGR